MEIIKLSLSKQKKILNSTLSLTVYHASCLYAIVPGEKSLFEAPRFVLYLFQTVRNVYIL